MRGMIQTTHPVHRNQDCIRFTISVGLYVALLNTEDRVSGHTLSDSLFVPRGENTDFPYRVSNDGTGRDANP
jgi:hypothetical protein